MILAVRIQLTLAENPATPLPNVQLSLYDRDENDPDDFLAQGTTDGRGEVLLPRVIPVAIPPSLAREKGLL